MTRPGTRKTGTSRHRNAVLSGAGSLAITGTGRVNKLVSAVLRDDPFARDTQNLRRDFGVALEAERTRRK